MRPFGGLIAWDSVSELREHLRRFGRSLLVGDGGSEIYSTILSGDPPLMVGILGAMGYQVPHLFRLNDALFVIGHDSSLTFVDVGSAGVASRLDLLGPFYDFIELRGWSFLAVHELGLVRFDRRGSIEWDRWSPDIITGFELEDENTLRVSIWGGKVDRVSLTDGSAVG